MSEKEWADALDAKDAEIARLEAELETERMRLASAYVKAKRGGA